MVLCCGVVVHLTIAFCITIITNAAISATPYSALQALDDQGKLVKMMEVLTIQDYSGINQMEHLKNSQGHNVFLDRHQIGPHDRGVEYPVTASTYETEAFREHLEKKKEMREAGKSLPSETILSEDAKLNPGCKGCQHPTGGCEIHTDIASKRWKAGRNSGFIPYTSQAMIDMFEQVLQSEKMGELILCATDPRVYADHCGTGHLHSKLLPQPG